MLGVTSLKLTVHCMGMRDHMTDVRLCLHPCCHLSMQASQQERALREFMCKLCSGMLHEPVSAPCGHHYCRPCLEKHFQVCSSSHIFLLCASFDAPASSSATIFNISKSVHICQYVCISCICIMGTVRKISTYIVSMALSCGA